MVAALAITEIQGACTTSMAPLVLSLGNIYAQQVYSSPAIMTTNSGTIVVVGDNDDYVRAFSVDYSGSLGGSGTQLWDYNTRYDPAPPGHAKYCQKNEELCGDAVWSFPAEGSGDGQRDSSPLRLLWRRR